MRQLILLIFCLVPFISYSLEDFENNMLTAKHRAGTEGKLIMVGFTAQWCSPCKFMDEHTYSDSRVDNYFKASFVPVKIDIDNFDGYALKQRYNVNVLPTILILNSKGELLSKYEESMAPSRLLQIMEQHDKPSNKIITIIPEPEPELEPKLEVPTQDLPFEGTNDFSDYNLSETTAEMETALAEATTETEPSYNIPNQLEEQPEEPTNIPHPGPERKPNLSYEVEEEQPLAENSVDAPLVTGNGLFRFLVEPQEYKGYSVQIGAFFEYENVLVQVSQLQQRYEDIIVHAIRKNDKPMYKILLGHYDNIEGAKEFAQQLDYHGMTGGFPIDLSTLK